MKNKTFISFCINVLVGILFSFPVFSAHSYVYDFSLNKSESSLSDNENFSDNNSNVIVKSHRFFPERQHNIICPYKFFGNNISGNKDQSDIKYLRPDFKEQISLNTFVNRNTLNHIFVNLSYLKDLRTTKMLC